MIVPADAGVARARFAASATRAARADMGWLDHDRLGFNYRLTRRSRRRSASRRSSGPTSCSPARDARRRRSTRALDALGGAPAGRAIPTASSCPAPTAATSGAAGSSTWSSCRPAPTATP